MKFDRKRLGKSTHSVRASQAIIQYGVGAMIDFPDQTLMTAAPEYWEKNTRIISDERLEKLLDVDCFRTPIGNNENKEGISYVRFPEWYFCPKCRDFKPLSEWVSLYRKKAGEQQRENDMHMIKNPKCYKDGCRINLVPARLVVCCEKGHIDDFPWVGWVHYNSRGEFHEICSNPDIEIVTGNSASEGLEGILVRCRTCKASSTLQGAFGTNPSIFKAIDSKNGREDFKCHGRHPWKNEKEKCNEYPRTLQRGASSVYFPVTYSSLVIPPYSEQVNLKIEESEEFKKALDRIKDESVDYRQEYIKRHYEKWAENIHFETGLGKERIMQTLERKWLSEGGSGNDQDLDRTAYKFGEYDALLGLDVYNDPFSDFFIETVDAKSYGLDYISNITLVHKVKEVQAMLGYSRIKPYEVGEEAEESSYVNIKKSDTRWYPAYEVRGEGVFIEFDDEIIKRWVSENPVVQDRIDDLISNYDKSYFARTRHRNITAKSVLLHTISHLLIRELSFESGYSIASIKERIYSSDLSLGKEMSGILLYTASGDSEGTLGGLVRQGRKDYFTKIFRNAIENARMCSNDPVCILSKGQGRESLNLSACHTCTLLPETSCEEFNIFLDRALVVGTFENKEMAFFHKHIYGEPGWIDKTSETVRSIKYKYKEGSGTPFGKSFAETIKYLKNEVTEEFESGILDRIYASDTAKNAEVSEAYVMGEFVGSDGCELEVDAVWFSEKVIFCLFENEESYVLLNVPGWNVFWLNEDFDVDGFLKKMVGE